MLNDILVLETQLEANHQFRLRGVYHRTVFPTNSQVEVPIAQCLQSMTVFEAGSIKEVIKLKEAVVIDPNPTWPVSLPEEVWPHRENQGYACTQETPCEREQVAI